MPRPHAAGRGAKAASRARSSSSSSASGRSASPRIAASAVGHRSGASSTVVTVAGSVVPRTTMMQRGARLGSVTCAVAACFALMLCVGCTLMTAAALGPAVSGAGIGADGSAVAIVPAGDGADSALAPPLPPSCDQSVWGVGGSALYVRLPDEEVPAGSLLPSRLAQLANATATAVLGSVPGPLPGGMPQEPCLPVVLVTQSQSIATAFTIVVRSYVLTPWLRIDTVATAHDAAEHASSAYELASLWMLGGAWRDDEVEEFENYAQAAEVVQPAWLSRAAVEDAFDLISMDAAEGAAASTGCVQSFITVLGNQPLDSGTPTLSTVRHVESATALLRALHSGDAASRDAQWRHHIADTPGGDRVCPPTAVVLTGGATGRSKVSEAVQMGLIAQSRGIPSSAIVLEAEARTTGQNAFNTAELIAQRLALAEEAPYQRGGMPVVLYVATDERHLSWAVPMFGRLLPAFRGDDAWRLRPLPSVSPVPELVAQMRAYVAAFPDATTISRRISDLEAGVVGVD